MTIIMSLTNFLRSSPTFLKNPKTNFISEFDAWICDILNLYDDNHRSQNAYIVDMNLTELSKPMKDLSKYTTFAAYNQLLLVQYL